ncbi:MAG: hypothetical protein FJW39_07725 [Acidobacteria bacterium]|nr:hypothetical protein [Acidobacteriota bacterium]
MIPARALLAAAFALLPSCGYHVAGKADLLPKSVRTIAIPAWGNITARHKLAERIPAALTREFISRTRYRIIADPREADAILTGAVSNILPFPTTFDPVTQRASGGQIAVILQVRLTERATGKILFDRPQFEARERYEISIDQVAYFEESSAALERVSSYVARQLVSAILENF